MKKLISILLSLCLLAAMLPAVLAQGEADEPAIIEDAGDTPPEASVGEDDRPLFEAEEGPSGPDAVEIDLDREEATSDSPAGAEAGIDFGKEDREATDAGQNARTTASGESETEKQLAEMLAEDEAEPLMTGDEGEGPEYGTDTRYWEKNVDFDMSNEERFAGYAERIFYAGSAEARRTMATDYAAGCLNAGQREVYELLKAALIDIAAGRRSSTEVEIPLTTLMGQTSFTSAELGVSIPESISFSEMDDQYRNDMYRAVYELIRPLAFQIIDALRADCNYELYWCNGPIGYTVSGLRIRQFGNDLFAYLDNGAIIFYFDVEVAYSTGEKHTVDTSLSAAAKQAAKNAQAIVDKYAACSDYVKLYGYMREICYLTDYNYTAAYGDWDRSKHDPWKLVWVFDGDPDTKVVCMGYAYAFHYLCELTPFDGGIRCYFVSGDCGGGHAWNVVRMEDGQNYIVDVTFMDSRLGGEVDSIDRLAYDISYGSRNYFLRGVDSERTYDESTLSLYPASVLTIAKSRYVPQGFMRIGGYTYFFNDEGAYLTGVLELNGEIYEFDDDGRFLGRVQGGLSGWQTIGGKRYFFEENGSLHTVHTVVKQPAVEATCTKTGLTEGSYCSVCQAVLKAQQTVDAKGHTAVVDPAVEATCTKTGLTEGSHCSVCQAVLKAQQTVAAKGHTVVVDPAVEPTGTKTGLTEGKHCSVCGTVLVKQQVIPKLTPTGIRLNKSGTQKLVLRKKLTLKATLAPAGVKSKLTWTSNKPEVATVTQKGVVKAVSKGKATITVTTANGKKAKVTIKTVAPEPKKVKFAQGKKATMKAGKKLTLTPVFTPLYAESKLTWTSDNKSVATVSQKGVVRAKKKGKATITVTTAKEKTAKITITVEK